MQQTFQNNLVLELHVPDFKRTQDFYGIFGFNKLSFNPASTDGNHLGYMVLERIDPIGRTVLNFYGDRAAVAGQTHFKNFPAETPRGYAVEITIPVSNVEALWKEANERIDSGQISGPLVLQPWGKKDFRVIDPAGFYVRFTELVDWGQ